MNSHSPSPPHSQIGHISSVCRRGGAGAVRLTRPPKDSELRAFLRVLRVRSCVRCPCCRVWLRASACRCRARPRDAEEWNDDWMDTSG